MSSTTTGNNRLTQQRVHVIPSKNRAFFDDDDVDDDDTSSVGCSFTSSLYASATSNDTFALAEFLSTTSPDEFAKPSSKKKLQQQHRASRLLSKLRKRGAITNTTNDTVSKGPTSTAARKHIPLPEYHPPPQPEIPELYQQQLQTKNQNHRLTTMSSASSSSTNTTPSLSSNHHHHQQYSPSLRDSGIYSEISDKDYISPPPPVPPLPIPALDLFPMPPPSIPAKSNARPRRPAPLPANVASAAIHAALRNVPEAALRRQSVIRQQHYQQQQQQQPSSGSEKAQQQEKEQELHTGACPHCRQHISSNSFNGKEKDNRRLSCPPALAPGELLIKNTNESNLRQMILQLEKQLADERLSRKKLEQAISRHHHQAVINKQEEVAEERDRWKNESLWMEDRIASLPE
ncbi:hypothetical protein BDC45DRAFT_511937 [Circinella umbellata]|nr:hypothetical protein BDC45DRAFT_511937 [Circinella umbellata]